MGNVKQEPTVSSLLPIFVKASWTRFLIKLSAIDAAVASTQGVL